MKIKLIIRLLSFCITICLFALLLIVYIFWENQSLNKQYALKAQQKIEAEVIRVENKLRGEELFKLHCQDCHLLVEQLHFTLDRSLQNLGEDFFITFTTKEDSLLLANDEQTLLINEEYNQNSYTHKFSLSDEEKYLIIEYLK